MLCRKAGADEAAITAMDRRGAAEASERQPAPSCGCRKPMPPGQMPLWGTRSVPGL
jgi:hypothetical protein